MMLCDKDNCTGCMACYNVCNRGAIKLKKDKEGFLYPDIDGTKCVNCHMCQNVCPHVVPSNLSSVYEKKVFSVWQKSKKILRNSTSGGAFSALASTILNRQGVVYGAGFDSNLKVIHKRITDMSALSEIRGSKYVQSEIGNTLKQVKTDINEGRLVLFTGTPCQIDALYRYLGDRYEDELYTVDLVCHGVPSPLVYDEYLKYISERYNSTIDKIYFRNKKPGWYVFGMKILFSNNKTYENDTYHDPYIRGFLREYFLRPSCHSCSYTNLNRPADITLDDDWGYKETCFKDRDNDQGISMVMINSKNGENLFELSRDNLKVFPRTVKEAVNGNQALNKCFPPNEHRDEFWNDFFNNSFEFVVEKYLYEEEIPSWTVERQKNIRAFRKAYFLDKAVHLPNYLLIKLLGANKYNYLKHIFKK